MCFFKKRGEKDLSYFNVLVILMLFAHLCLQSPQKRERKVTPNIKQELMNEDEFTGSTDLDEPGLLYCTFTISLMP